MDEGFYPVKERLFDGFDTSNKDAVLLIDVGGGFGHYTEELLSKFPNCPGRLILQDLPPVIGRIQQLHPRIEKMEYDFFTEQLDNLLIPRCTRLLHALHPSRLARRAGHKDWKSRQGSHEAWLQQVPHS